MTISRRSVCLNLAAFSTLATAWPISIAVAKSVVKLEWGDLIPANGKAPPKVLEGRIRHDQASLAARQPASIGARAELDGKTVSLSGFVVPLDFEGVGLSSFILVPYVGACIHVPPPPANQLVLVSTKEPYESGGLFEPITVTGRIEVTATSTEIADIGYAMAATKIAPYSD
jgi:hypothetical protein